MERILGAFLERRKDKEIINAMVITHKTGVMIIDRDEFEKLPESQKNEIMKLAEANSYEYKTFTQTNN